MTNKIKARRTELGMTQEQLASACGIGRSTISEIEDGKHDPSVGVALRIAQALNQTVDELFSLN